MKFQLQRLFQRLTLSTMPVTSPMKVDSNTAATGIEPSPKKLRVEAEDQLLIAKLSENATIPTRGSDKAAGYDLYSAEVMRSFTQTGVHQALTLFYYN